MKKGRKFLVSTMCVSFLFMLTIGGCIPSDKIIHGFHVTMMNNSTQDVHLFVYSYEAVGPSNKVTPGATRKYTVDIEYNEYRSETVSATVYVEAFRNGERIGRRAVTASFPVGVYEDSAIVIFPF